MYLITPVRNLELIRMVVPAEEQQWLDPRSIWLAGLEGTEEESTLAGLFALSPLAQGLWRIAWFPRGDPSPKTVKELGTRAVAWAKAKWPITALAAIVPLEEKATITSFQRMGLRRQSVLGGMQILQTG